MYINYPLEIVNLHLPVETLQGQSRESHLNPTNVLSNCTRSYDVTLGVGKRGSFVSCARIIATLLSIIVFPRRLAGSEWDGGELTFHVFLYPSQNPLKFNSPRVPGRKCLAALIRLRNKRQ